MVTIRILALESYCIDLKFWQYDLFSKKDVNFIIVLVEFPIFQQSMNDRM